MSSEERVAALEGLLSRIQRNASKPRPLGAAPAAVVPMTAAPAQISQPFEPAAPTAAQTAAIDRSIDDFLEAPIPLVQAAATGSSRGFASAPPISLEPPPLPTPEPPVVELNASMDAEEAAIPLVGAKSYEAPLPVEPPESEETSAEELGEDDFLSVPPEAIEAETGASDDLDFEDDEEVPASSQRARVASTMDEALADAAEHADDVPLKTPPPESGPQASMPAVLEAPRLPEIHETEGHVGGANILDMGPTPEQLGETIELPEPSTAQLELDVRAQERIKEMDSQPASEELEVALPRRSDFAGVYDASLAPPEAAREDLRRLSEAAAAMDSGHAPVVQAVEIHSSEVVVRPELPGVSTARFVAAATFQPQSFVELLDASLRLGTD